MAKLNLLKSSFTGKLGGMVGAKWKDLNTVRVYTAPSNPNTPAQQKVRGIFKSLTALLSMVAPQIQTVSALSTKSMSLKNALVKINKEQFSEGVFDPTAILLSSGSLPAIAGFANNGSTSASFKFSWTVISSSRISAQALTVVVVYNMMQEEIYVGTAPYSSGQIEIAQPFSSSLAYLVYYYIFDKHGQTKIASVSKVFSGLMRDATLAPPVPGAADQKSPGDSKAK